MTTKWGKYFVNNNPTTINTAELDKAKTLSLYLYGALSRPADPADYIRPVNAPKLKVAIDGQAYFDTIGAITPYILAEKRARRAD